MERPMLHANLRRRLIRRNRRLADAEALPATLLAQVPHILLDVSELICRAVLGQVGMLPLPPWMKKLITSWISYCGMSRVS